MLRLVHSTGASIFLFLKFVRHGFQLESLASTIWIDRMKAAHAYEMEFAR